MSVSPRLGNTTHRLLPDPLPETIGDALELAVRLGQEWHGPGGGHTLTEWKTLAEIAAHDLQLARAIEPHLDAVSILRQAGEAAPVDRYGVYAAEGPASTLVARRSSDGWVLTGSKPWCSLAQTLDRALVTAADTGGNRLFDVDLRHPGVTVTPNTWHAVGLTDIPSGPVDFDAVPARALGAPGWYTERPQFAWGGAGVAACWYGGAVALAEDLRGLLHENSPETALAHLGAVDEILGAARLALAECAMLADAGAPGRLPAKRARGIVARAADEVIWRSARALGPAPLALDEAHARRVADLDIYVRQHAVDRERASLGAAAIGAESAPW